MYRREGASSSSTLAYSVDEAAKVSLMGRCRDFARCKAQRRDESQCTMPVNRAACAYCEFHVGMAHKVTTERNVPCQPSRVLCVCVRACVRAYLLEVERVNGGRS